MINKQHSKTFLRGSFCLLNSINLGELTLHPKRLFINYNQSSMNITTNTHEFEKRLFWLSWTKWKMVNSNNRLRSKESCLKECDAINDKWEFISVSAGNGHAAFVTSKAELILISNNQSASFFNPKGNTIPWKNYDEDGNCDNKLFVCNPCSKRHVSECNLLNKVNTSWSSACERWYTSTYRRHASYLHELNNDDLATKEANKLNNECTNVTRRKASNSSNNCLPYLIDLSRIFNSSSTKLYKVVCGCNSIIVYEPDGCKAVVLGPNNYIKEEALKCVSNAEHPFHYQILPILERNVQTNLKLCNSTHENAYELNTKEEVVQVSQLLCLTFHSPVKEIVCGFNHTFVTLTSGCIFAYGNNTYGELALGTLSSTSIPKEVTFFSEHNIKIKKIAAGNSFSLFLTEDGRVYGSGSGQHGQLTEHSESPTFIPLLRGFVSESNGGESTSALINEERETDQKISNKLIKIKDVVCVGTVAVYLSNKNEILLQGSWEEFGFYIRSPRLLKVSQTKMKEAFRKQMVVNNSDCNFKPDSFDIVELYAGINTLLIRYKNGCIGGLGVNTEGELVNSSKIVRRKTVNFATAFSAKEVLTVFLPRENSVDGFDDIAQKQNTPLFALGNGFMLVVDNEDVYNKPNDVKRIHLPH